MILWKDINFTFAPHIAAIMTLVECSSVEQNQKVFYCPSLPRSLSIPSLFADIIFH